MIAPQHLYNLTITVYATETGQAVELELPFYLTGRDIIVAVLNAGVLRGVEPGADASAFALHHERTDFRLENHTTLYDLDASHGDVLLLTPLRRTN